MAAVNQVFFHAPDRSLFLHPPPGLPGLEAPESLLAILGAQMSLASFRP